MQQRQNSLTTRKDSKNTNYSFNGEVFELQGKLMMSIVARLIKERAVALFTAGITSRNFQNYIS